MMRQIYQQAHSVTIWLGLETASSPHGMNLLNSIERVWDTCGGRLPPARKLLEEGWLKKMLPEGRSSWDLAPWNGLIEILRRPYWTRRWIIQEVVVTSHPERIQLLCGNKKASFQIFSRVLRRLHGIHDATPLSERKQKSIISQIAYESTNAERICDHVKSWLEENKNERDVGLLRLLHDYHPSLCTDAKDRVYALLGVALSYEGVELDINYAIDEIDVYKNTAKYLIEGSKHLDVLLFCQNSPERRSERQPSWVPDWRRYDRTDRLIRYCRTTEGTWDAAGGLLAAATFSSDGNILKTRAYVIGTVMSKYDPHNDLLDSNPNSLKKVLSLWLTYATIIKDITTRLSADTVEAFYETLVCTRYGPDRPRKSRIHEFSKFCLMCWNDRDPLGRKGSLPVNLETMGWPLSRSILEKIIVKNRQLCAVETIPIREASKERSWLATQNVRHDFSNNKRMGLCTPWAEVGDTVLVIPGCRHPVLLRQVGERYELIDEIYVHGFMRGEAIGKFSEIEVELI
jgi:hypothetical protein